MIGLALRIYLLSRTAIISRDGILLIEFAQRSSAGDYIWGPGTVHPLYPAFVALAHRFVPVWDQAGQVVSCLFGTALLLPLYGLARRWFGHEVAFLACLFTALHPLLARYAADVLNDSTYYFFLLSGLYCGWTGLAQRSLWRFVGAGLCGAFGYLTRLEGLGLLPVLVLWLILGRVGPAGRAIGWRWRVLAAACVLLGFVSLSFPYFATARQEMGRWTFSMRKDVWRIIGLTDRSWNDFSLKELAVFSGVAVKKGIEACHQLLAFLVLVGGLAPSTGAHERWARRYVGLVGVVWGWALLREWLMYDILSHRFIMPMVLLLLPWAGRGASFLASHAVKLRSLKTVWRVAGVASQPVLLAALVVSGVLIPKAVKPRRSEKLVRKEVGEWIRANGRPNPRILTDVSRVAYYAGGIQLEIPARAKLSYDGVFLTARDQHADYLVVEAMEHGSDPPQFLSVRPDGLRLIHARTAPTRQQGTETLLVYEVLPDDTAPLQGLEEGGAP